MKTKFYNKTTKKNLNILPHNNFDKKSIFFNSKISTMPVNDYFLNINKKNDFEKTILPLEINKIKIKESNKRLRSSLEAANIMAHSLKTPLTSLEFLSNKNSITESDKMLIQLTVKKLRQTISDIQLLDTAVLANKNTKKMQHTDINIFITNVFNEVSSIYKHDTNINFTLTTTAQHIESLIQIEDFKDAIFNIIKNAYEAIETQGDIDIKLTCVHNIIEIRITDNGKGMPKEILDNIGKKFVTYGKQGGTGIGMYQVVKTIKKTGGKYKIKSEPGIGTQVSLFIPKTNYFFVP